MPKAEITNRVRQLRAARDGMSQHELADRCACTRQTIIALEKERYVPSLALAFRIARVLGEPIDRVFTYVEGTD